MSGEEEEGNGLKHGSSVRVSCLGRGVNGSSVREGCLWKREGKGLKYGGSMRVGCLCRRGW